MAGAFIQVVGCIYGFRGSKFCDGFVAIDGINEACFVVTDGFVNEGSLASFLIVHFLVSTKRASLYRRGERVSTKLASFPIAHFLVSTKRASLYR